MNESPAVLAIDCATLPASVALVRRDGVAAEVVQDDDRRTDAWIALAIEQCLERSGIDIDGLEAIAVSIGPGTFTGIRVGIATALGLAAPRRLPVAGIGSLDALACIGLRSAVRVAACIDARRGQVYGALYDAPPGDLAHGHGKVPQPAPKALPSPLWGPAVCSPEELSAALGKHGRDRRVIGSGAAVLADAGVHPALENSAAGAEEIGADASGCDPVPLAAAVGELALRAWPEGSTEPPDWPPAAPVYLRPPDARPPRNPLLERSD